ncbi:MAG: glycosyltransferase family 4 protein, partial [Actinomycetota bacterium]|nr:glycosyltransferase family 4 protein [Actinomycetota bacterium]
MARHLRRLGHEVTVVACDAWGRLPDDAELDVVRVGDLRSARPLRRLLRRGKLLVAGDEGTLEAPPTALLTKVFVPDMHVVTWLPGLLVALRRLVDRDAIDCLVTTSPPETAHVAGLMLGARRPAWIADFRDGWTFEPWRDPFPTSAQRTLDTWLERRVAQAAQVTIGATRPIAEDLARRLGARAAW